MRLFHFFLSSSRWTVIVVVIVPTAGREHYRAIGGRWFILSFQQFISSPRFCFYLFYLLFLFFSLRHIFSIFSKLEAYNSSAQFWKLAKVKMHSLVRAFRIQTTTCKELNSISNCLEYKYHPQLSCNPSKIVFVALGGALLYYTETHACAGLGKQPAIWFVNNWD